MKNLLLHGFSVLAFALLLNFNLYGQCPNQLSDIIGDSICANTGSAKITIETTTIGATYQAYYLSTPKGSPVTSVNMTTVLNIPLGTGENQLDPLEQYTTLTVKASMSGCPEATLSNSATIIIEPLPFINVEIVGSEVCNTDSLATITIPSTITGVSYQVYKNSKLLKEFIGFDGTYWLDIPVSTLFIGKNSIEAKATAQGCVTVTVRDTTDVIVNVKPEIFIDASGSTISGRDDSAYVTIQPFDPTYDYVIYKNSLPVESHKSITNEILSFKFFVENSVVDDFVIKVEISNPFLCGPATFSDTALIRVNRILTSLSGLNAQPVFNIWPNPVFSDLNIRSENLFNNIRIMNMLGTLVYESSFEPVHQFSISTDLPKGIYNISIGGQDFKTQARIIKQ